MSRFVIGIIVALIALIAPLLVLQKFSLTSSRAGTPKPTIAHGLARLRFNPFETWLAFVALVSGVSLVLDPALLKLTPIGQVLATYRFYWALAYGIDGLLVLFALLRFRIDWEIFALSILSGTLVIQTLALVSVLGRAAITSILVNSGLVAACISRIRTLFLGLDRYVPLSGEPPEEHPQHV